MSLDNNTWYSLTATASNYTRSLQWCSLQIVCYSDTNTTGLNAHWQFSWPNDTDRQHLILRNRGKGPDAALAVFLNGNETQPGFAALEDKDPTQQWDAVSVSITDDVSWSLFNIANGTGFRLAERGSDSVFLASSTTSDASSQQWIANPMAAIDDAAYSLLATSATATTAATSTATVATSTSVTPTTTLAAATATNGAATGGNIDAAHSKLSTGAIVGISLACLAVLVAAVLLFVRQRRRGIRKQQETPRATRTDLPSRWETSVGVEKSAEAKMYEIPANEILSEDKTRSVTAELHGDGNRIELA